MVKLVGLLLVFFLALLVSFPAPCLAAESSAAPAAKSAPTAVIDPDMDEGHRQFAHANYEKALEHYLKALEKNKEDAYLYFRIGLTYYMLDDMDNSHSYWVKSYDFDMDFPNKYISASRVLGNEMFPTLMPGDLFIVDDQYYNYISFKYKDVVEYKHPFDNKSVLVNRIVGLQNDSIALVDNHLVRNNLYIQEDYINKNNNKMHSDDGSDMKQINIPMSCLFVLGDNRKISYDSRHHGCINKNNVVGRVLIVTESTEDISGEQHIREKRYGLIIK